MRLIIATLAVGALVAGCARKPVTWEKPSVDEGQVAIDRQECQAWAARQVEREAREEPIGGTESSRLGSSYDATMRRHDLRRRRTELFDSCMKTRGYRPEEKK